MVRTNPTAPVAIAPDTLPTSMFCIKTAGVKAIDASRAPLLHEFRVAEDFVRLFTVSIIGFIRSLTSC